MSSSAQNNANKANAQLSTGPKTTEGKAKSSLNAVKTGLTGRTVLRPTEDADIYSAHIASYITKFNPESDREKTLVQALADTEWRLNRISDLEHGIFARGHLEFTPQYANEPEEMRKSLTQTQIFLIYRKELNSLTLLEKRLRRQSEEDKAELENLIFDRNETERRSLVTAGRLFEEAREEAGVEFDPAEFGFEFSSGRIEEHLAQSVKERHIRRGTYYQSRRNQNK